MNAVAAEIFARGYVTGFFDIVSELTGGAASASLEAPVPIVRLDWSGVAAECDLILASLIGGGGAIAVLLPGEGAATIYGTVTGDVAVAWDKVREADNASLREVFKPCMGGGVSHFKQKYGEVMAIENVTVSVDGSNAARELLVSAVGADGIAAVFGFDVASVAGKRGVVLFSARFEGIIPSDVVAAAESKTGGPGVGESLSPDDANEILSENSGGRESESTAAVGRSREPTSPESATKNLDMVLDIRLVATARLGRVEMPISEILSLGPGSIIEVGHLVDEPVELLVNDKLIARGDVVVVDEKFGLRITEIVSPRERIESLR